ncbi:MAG: helical backbone metal receptor [Polaromonas sp.]|uniref:ABC transporter substrate-binding protein n=1 Tax=Polaromonas sp. TaxID=1869339 RepID=UPI002737419E|nr:helical backbone metal receptor [Polaromonas sp.]MDP3797615.1 helical backbone metal receptor [Polaromonas sp.]
MNVLRLAPRCALLLALLGGAGAAPALQLTDDRGVTVTLAQAPQRIVSLLPSLTETVCELSQCQRLVGVDRYSNFPDSVQKLAQVGGGLDPNIEAIVALKPDVVLMATSSRAGERLQALGIRVVALEPRSHADVQRVMLKLGQLLEVRDAARIWRAIDAGVSAAAQSLPASVRGTRVYFEVNQGPYAAGESSFIGETLTRLGVKNIVPAKLGPFPKLNPEYIVRANPDLIMIGQRSADGLQTRPGWQGIRALREQRVCIFLTEEANVLVRPGPRMAEGARLMAKCLMDKAPALAATRASGVALPLSREEGAVRALGRPGGTDVLPKAGGGKP